MEKIKIDVYIKGQLVSLGNIVVSDATSNVSQDDPRYDFSEAIVIEAGALTGGFAVPEGKVIAVEKDITSTTHGCNAEQFEQMLADVLPHRYLWGERFYDSGIADCQNYVRLADITQTGTICVSKKSKN